MPAFYDRITDHLFHERLFAILASLWTSCRANVVRASAHNKCRHMRDTWKIASQQLTSPQMKIIDHGTHYKLSTFKMIKEKKEFILKNK